MFPYKFNLGQRIATDVITEYCDRAFLAHFQIPAVSATLGVADSIRESFTVGATPVTKTDLLLFPSVPRNITATAGGTSASIKAVAVTITGTNYNDEVITEALPVFTEDTNGIVVGNKAFKTVTSVAVPAMDGAGVTITIGDGAKLGLPYKLTHNTVLNAYLGNVKEGTAPTITVSASAIESNTISLNSALDGSIVDVYLIC